VLRWMADHDLDLLEGSTGLLIAPGYRIRLADALITNFHQPGSTLLLLVEAFVGPGWRRIYDHALSSGYRFLSYGDSSLLFRGQ
jgi:S-adenosylmethionine:tRNA ribosyltransferase-isomerase